MQARDFFGRPIEVNHVLAYPVRRGSSMFLKSIKVTQVGDTTVSGYQPAGRLVTLKRLDNTVVVQDPQ